MGVGATCHSHKHAGARSVVPNVSLDIHRQNPTTVSTPSPCETPGGQEKSTRHESNEGKTACGVSKYTKNARIRTRTAPGNNLFSKATQRIDSCRLFSNFQLFVCAKIHTLYIKTGFLLHFLSQDANSWDIKDKNKIFINQLTAHPERAKQRETRKERSTSNPKPMLVTDDVAR